MKSTFLFALVLCTPLFLQLTSAQSCAAESKNRRESCPHLVIPYPPGKGCWAQGTCCSSDQGCGCGGNEPTKKGGGGGSSTPSDSSPAAGSSPSGNSSPTEGASSPAGDTSSPASGGSSPAGGSSSSDNSSPTEEASSPASGGSSPAAGSSPSTSPIEITTEGGITTITTSEETCTCTCQSTNPTEGGGSESNSPISSIFTTSASEATSEASGETSEASSGTSESATDETGGVSEETSEGASEGVTSEVSGSTGSGGYIECELTDALFNISFLLSGYEYEIFIELIHEMQITVLADTSLTYEEMVVRCGYMLKIFLEAHVDIKEIIYYEQIGSWGYVVDFIYVCYQIQLEITQSIIELDSNDNCKLFDAIRNATTDDEEKSKVCEKLIANITVILKTSSWTYTQQQAQIYILFQEFFAEYSEWESFFKKIQISSYGYFEYYFDVAFWYHQITTISVIIGGDVDDCVLVQALYEASQNSSYSTSVRNQFQELYEKIEGYFSQHTEISLRLNYLVSQCYSLWELSAYMEVYTYKISCGSWGEIYSIIFCSNICVNEGCDNIDDGSGCSTGEPSPGESSPGETSPGESSPGETTSSGTLSPIGSSPGETSPGESTSSVTSSPIGSSPGETSPGKTSSGETTSSVTSSPGKTTSSGASSIKPADCFTRWSTLEVYKYNETAETTDFTFSIQGAYDTWSKSTRASFNSYKNQIWSAVFNKTAAKQDIFSQVITSCTDFNKNNQAKRQVLWDVKIIHWEGTIGEFVNCGNDCGCS